MNFWGYFFVTTAAVLVVFIQQTNGIELSLCLRDIINNDCQSDNNNVCSASSSPRTSTSSRSDINNRNKNAADSRLVLRDGYNKFNSTVRAAEEKAMNGLSSSSRLVDTQPAISAQIARNAILDAQDTILDAVAGLYLSFAEAMTISNNSVARQGLGQGVQRVNLAVIELLEQMRGLSILANEDQVISDGGDSAKEAIELARQGLKAGFAALYFEANNSYQLGNRSISDNQLQCGATKIKSTNMNNNDAVSEDRDAQEAIAGINKSADDAIRKGASPSKVNQLKNMLIDALKNLAGVAGYVRDYFTATTQIAAFDPISAENLYIGEAKKVCKKIQEIFANVCLDMGAAAVKADESTKNQIRDAIKELQKGIDGTIVGNKIAKYFTLYALYFKGDEPTKSALFKAAAQSGRFAKISFNKRVAQGGNKTLNALAGNRR